jgi:uncharacterized repeat protein (TIGR03803 family)
MKTRTYQIKTSTTLALACTLLVVLTAAPLHAQFYQDLYDFNCNTGGCGPVDNGELTQGSDGYLYGTTQVGGASNYGTVFKVASDGTGYTTLWQFNGANGQSPSAALTLASDGNFYGTTEFGGSFSNGTIFRITSSGVLKVLHSFNANVDGGQPLSPPAESKDGNLYGVTLSGTAYRITLPAGSFKALSFNQPPFESLGPLLLASDGNLYGATHFGGKFNQGTLFSMTTGGVVKVIHSFSDSDGNGTTPSGPLTQGKDGKLYGTTQFEGAALNDSGTVFNLTLPSYTLTTLHSFDPLNVGGTNNDGAIPSAGLLAASDGNFYGAASNGGANTLGTLFEISAGGFFTKLDDFTGTAGSVPGANPNTTLVEHTNGSFYGLAMFGGANSGGVFYRLTPPNPFARLRVAGPVWVKPGDAVEILGENLTQVINLTFGEVPAQFQAGSDTYLVATVPSAAVDGLITATLATGLQVESQMAVHILPKITNLDPTSGVVGTQVGIVGGGFAGTKKVTFGGVKTNNFTVVSPTLIQATVPTGAKTGKVGVVTPNGSATSKQIFTVN